MQEIEEIDVCRPCIVTDLGRGKKMTRTAPMKALLSMTALAVSAPIYANVFDSYGPNAASQALGNADTAGGDTVFAAYTNPARLVQAKRSEFGVNASLTRFHLSDLASAPGSQLPADRDRASIADDLQGTSFAVNLKLLEQLHFGLAAYMPQGSFGRIKGVSPYQSTYLRFGETQGKPAVYSALGLQLPYGFSVGAGAYYTLKAKGVLQLSLSDVESEGRIDLNMEPVVAPYFGIAWQSGALQLGATYRDAQETDSKIEAAFAFHTDDFTLPFNANTSLVPFYDPALFRIGASWSFASVQVLASFEQAFWSQYKLPLVNLSGKDVASISAESGNDSAHLRDTQAYRVGVIVPFTGPWQQALEYRGGLEWHTSANEKGSKSPIVDPARQVIASGLSTTFAVDDSGRKLRLDASYQHSFLQKTDRVSPKGAVIKVGSGHSIQTLSGGLTYEL